jgi:pimeloyl-ACP methyl ester carboxylesterase
VRLLLALLLPGPLLLAQEKAGAVAEHELPGAGKKDPPIVYAVYRATSAKGDAKLPLILALHGGRGTARQFASFLMPAAEAAGALLVSAQGLREIVGADGYWWKGGPDEAAALDRLVEHVRATRPIDPARFTVVGLADGAELGMRWAVEKNRGVRGVIAVNFLWRPPGPPKAPKELKFCLIASRDAKEKLAQLGEQAEKARKAIEGAGYPVVLRIVPGDSRSFFHGWEKEFQNAFSWFDGKLDWPKEIAAAGSK